MTDTVTVIMPPDIDTYLHTSTHPSPHHPCCALTVIVFLQTCIIGFLPSHSCAKKDIGNRAQHGYCSTVLPQWTQPSDVLRT